MDEHSLVNGVSAILLISPDAVALAEFYAQGLGLELLEEVHEGVPVHYACDLGGVHFAIHPAEGWPGVGGIESQSPVVALSVSNAAAAAERLRSSGTSVNGPFDHGFAWVVSFRDPDGNHVELLEESPEEKEA